ncbi:MAG: 3-isopropylmalate dehydrogenase [Deltaproteobacteria bacterium ADurb.BinA179]|mgnify:CR=1 FL=1|jgi:3-isopropylmalate dehydrogenase|nr:3-isopropylmalate dehydrogenase [Deltaproteobacteria bacterium]MDI9542273.1 3-isopropylmalate dehydrogenase [Pseudomonadota bacterium]NLW67730.1 3-isopropylmalate dehydrogenase [Bacteriovoracaceae bacterium]OPZ29083.1 MAG: 3-isopropylmalate dehydrogenase [Deltaproteobacteria bacterium ADurb.BinA179]HRR21350.1 3-isopropylmalate dehydrogenase [Desulfomonilia bacterium]
MEKTLAVLEGDGIGPEIVREAVKVLKAVGHKYGHRFVLNYAPFGAGAYFAQGSPFPEKTREICDASDIIIKGPVGLAVEQMNLIPPEQRPEIGAILPLRKRYDTFANFRPVRLPRNLAHFSPLKAQVIGDGIDILMIRELVGGIYFGAKIEGSATGMRYSTDECTYTADEIQRVAEVAFEEAKRRSCPLINIHKANVLATSRFWKEVVEDIARSYPDVPYRSLLVDNAAYQLVKNPALLNGVMLLENMQGDILTDQAGGIIGSLGLMPSACIGPEKSYVEPAHGSAPDIAGKNIANPYSMIGSIALMFDRCLGLTDEADEIWNALFAVFERGYVTADLAQDVHERTEIITTEAFGDMVVQHILKSS